MRNGYLCMLLFLFMLPMQGCLATFFMANKIHERESSSAEFDMQHKSYGENREGHYVGRRTFENKMYRHYQFPDVLVGPTNRILDIYVPEDLDQKSVAIVTESSKFRPGRPLPL